MNDIELQKFKDAANKQLSDDFEMAALYVRLKDGTFNAITCGDYYFLSAVSVASGKRAGGNL